jgi:hypothetical protein
MTNKTVYLQNGDQVTLVSEFQWSGKTKYVVLYSEDQGDYGTFEELQLVDVVYNTPEETPRRIRKSELEKEIEELTNQKNELLKVVKLNNLKIAPKYRIGQVVYTLDWNNKIKEETVKHIVVYINGDKVTYEYRNWDNMGINGFETNEEAEIEVKKREQNLEERSTLAEINKYEEALRVVKEHEDKVKALK